MMNIDQLIKKITTTNEKAIKVQETLSILTDKLLETSEAFRSLGQSIDKVLPAAGKAEKLSADFLRDLSVKQRNIFLVKNIDHIIFIKEAYHKQHHVWKESFDKLEKLIALDNPALEDRIKLQKGRVAKFKMELDALENSSIKQLQSTMCEQEGLIRSNTMILMEFQKYAMGQCSASFSKII